MTNVGGYSHSFINVRLARPGMNKTRLIDEAISRHSTVLLIVSETGSWLFPSIPYLSSEWTLVPLSLGLVQILTNIENMGDPTYNNRFHTFLVLRMCTLDHFTKVEHHTLDVYSHNQSEYYLSQPGITQTLA